MTADLIRVVAFSGIIFSVVFDLVTEIEQNETAVLLGIAGILLLILAELREAREADHG